VLTIDLVQFKDKSDYYHSFKTRLEGWPKTMFWSQVGLTIDLSQHNDKNDYYYSFKTWLGNQPGARTRLRPGWPLTRVYLRINIVIIIILKLYSGVDPGPDFSHGSVPGLGLTIDPSQNKNKNKNKNDYYHSFKTQLRGRPMARPKSRVEMVNPCWSKAV
jgi:hypothetical protein